jgi:hypothetical protein
MPMVAPDTTVFERPMWKFGELEELFRRMGSKDESNIFHF